MKIKSRDGIEKLVNHDMVRVCLTDWLSEKLDWLDEYQTSFYGIISDVTPFSFQVLPLKKGQNDYRWIPISQTKMVSIEERDANKLRKIGGL